MNSFRQYMTFLIFFSSFLPSRFTKTGFQIYRIKLIDCVIRQQESSVLRKLQKQRLLGQVTKSSFFCNHLTSNGLIWIFNSVFFLLLNVFKSFSKRFQIIFKAFSNHFQYVFKSFSKRQNFLFKFFSNLFKMLQGTVVEITKEWGTKPHIQKKMLHFQNLASSLI